MLVEDSPWAYLCRLGHVLAPSQRAAMRAVLAPLTLPDVSVVLQTSGRAVGLRHPLYHHSPDDYSP